MEAVKKTIINNDKPYHINKHGKGTTHKIRAQLNFTDERKWKKFSSRRLDLVDKFGLSERKASEQDDNIKQIADILRREFDYPESSILEFEKLVTAAVQSVRRNRKRSKKRFLINSNTSANSNIESFKNSNPINININNNNNSDSNNHSENSLTDSNLNNNMSTSSSSSTSSTMSSPMTNKNNLFFNPTSTNATNVATNVATTITTTTANNNDTNKNGRILLPVMANRLPPFILNNNNSTTSTNSNATTNANIKPQNSSLLVQSIINSFLNFNFNSLNGSKINFKIPNYLIIKILQNINSSTTFNSLSRNSNLLQNVFEPVQSSGITINNNNNLLVLGEMSINSSIAFVIERYFNLQSIILNSNLISRLVLNLFTLLTSELAYLNCIDLKLLNNDARIKFINLIFGSVVKDFGFDSILYPLNEVFQFLIKWELNTDNNNSNTNSPTSSSTATVTATTSIFNPQTNGLNQQQIQHQHTNINNISNATKKQTIILPPLSTLKSLIPNNNSTNLMKNNIISSTTTKSFNTTTNNLNHPFNSSFNGLAILSDVSTKCV